jgi:hypothetical protein
MERSRERGRTRRPRRLKSTSASEVESLVSRGIRDPASLPAAKRPRRRRELSSAGAGPLGTLAAQAAADADEQCASDAIEAHSLRKPSLARVVLGGEPRWKRAPLDRDAPLLLFDLLDQHGPHAHSERVGGKRHPEKSNHPCDIAGRASAETRSRPGPSGRARPRRRLPGDRPDSRQRPGPCRGAPSSVQVQGGPAEEGRSVEDTARLGGALPCYCSRLVNGTRNVIWAEGRSSSNS